MITGAELFRRLKLAEEKLDEIEKQLDEDIVECEVPDRRYGYYCGQPTITVHEITTEGKINAILKHLGITLDINEEKVVKASVKISKNKKEKK